MTDTNQIDSEAENREDVPPAEESPYAKGEEGARGFLERLLHSSAWAKHKVLLYPEKHPLVQEQLKELHDLIAEALKDRRELILEFKPGCIVVDKKYEVGGKEDIKRFSEDMYQRRVARLRFQNSLDLPSLFKFLKFINTDTDSLHTIGAVGADFFSSFRGISIDQVDYGRLTRIHGESLERDPAEEEGRSVLEILFGKTGAGRYKGEPVSKYIQIREEILAPLRDLIETRKDLPPPDPTLPPGVMVSRAFRNIVDEIYQTNPEESEDIKKELAWSMFRMSPRIRSELLIEELQNKGRTGNLFKLFEYMSNNEIRETLASLRTQMDSEGFPELFDEMIKVFEAIHLKGTETHKDIVKRLPNPAAVCGKEFLFHVQEDLTPDKISGHYKKIVYEIFQSTQSTAAIEKCLDALLGDVVSGLERQEWVSAIQSLKNIMFSLKAREGVDSGDLQSFIRKITESVLPVLKIITLDALETDDAIAMERCSETLRMINLTPEHVLLKSLAEVEDRSLRKKILGFVLESEHLPLATIHEMLNHEEWYVVRNAVTLIKEKADSYYMPLLIKTIDHPHPSVVKETMLALTRLGSEKVLSLLFQVFQDVSRSSEVRAFAIDCMGTYPSEKTKSVYLEMLRDPRILVYDKDLREAGIRQLERFPEPEIIAELSAFIRKFHLLNNKTWKELKKTALRALKGMNTPEANKAAEQAYKYIYGKD